MKKTLLAAGIMLLSLCMNGQVTPEAFLGGLPGGNTGVGLLYSRFRNRSLPGPDSTC